MPGMEWRVSLLTTVNSGSGNNPPFLAVADFFKLQPAVRWIIVLISIKQTSEYSFYIPAFRATPAEPSLLILAVVINADCQCAGDIT